MLPFPLSAPSYAGESSLAIKAVLFDMGNTLIKYDLGSPEEVFHRVLASMAISKSVDEIKRAFSSAEKEAENLNLPSAYGRIPCEEYWCKWDTLVLKHLGVAESKELANLVHSTWFDHIDWAPYPKAKDVLLKLEQMKLKLGLITTAYEEEVDLILGKANIQKKIFDVIVGADTIGEAKPHPEVFRYALRILRAEPDEALFIGNRVDTDYEAAENVGLKAILVHRTESDTSRPSLRVITSLEEIFEYIN